MAEVAKQNSCLVANQDTFLAHNDGSEVDLIVARHRRHQGLRMKGSKKNATPSTKSFSNTYNVPVEVITKDNVARPTMNKEGILAEIKRTAAENGGKALDATVVKVTGIKPYDWARYWGAVE